MLIPPVASSPAIDLTAPQRRYFDLQSIIDLDCNRTDCIRLIDRRHPPTASIINARQTDDPHSHPSEAPIGVQLSVGMNLIARLRHGQRAMPRVSVRLSDQELSHPVIQSYLRRKAGLIPQELHYLQLEISESAVTDPLLQSQLATWCSLGIRLAVDHFGRTNQALGCLNSLHCTRVILDPSMVSQLLSNEQQRRHLHTWIRGFESIGKRVIVKTVDRREHLDWLGEHDCRLMGGDALSPLESCQSYELQVRSMTGQGINTSDRPRNKHQHAGAMIRASSRHSAGCPT